MCKDAHKQHSHPTISDNTAVELPTEYTKVCKSCPQGNMQEYMYAQVCITAFACMVICMI